MRSNFCQSICGHICSLAIHSGLQLNTELLWLTGCRQKSSAFVRAATGYLLLRRACRNSCVTAVMLGLSLQMLMLGQCDTALQHKMLECSFKFRLGQ